MKEVLYTMRIICALEGFSGFILNLILLWSLVRSQKATNKIFLVPIYVSALQGLYLCIAIAFMNFTHIFYDGTLAVPLIGPSVQFIPKFWRDLLYQYTVPMTMPSFELSEIMGKTFKNLYGMAQEEFLECYGISIRYADINNGKSLLTFTVTFCLIPYLISYIIIVSLMIKIRRMLSSQGFQLSKRTLRLQRQFFIMQLLQSFLPLVILSIPLAIIMYGALTGAQLGFWSLPLTIFVWICPVVLAGVQLRYVLQSSASTPESSRVAASRTDLSRRS